MLNDALKRAGQWARAGVRGRFPDAYDQVRMTLWQFKSLDRLLAHRLGQPAPAPSAGILQELRRDGIAVRTLQELFGLRDPLPEEVSACAQALWDARRAEVARAGDAAEAVLVDSARKEYRAHLVPRRLGFAHPLIRLALDERVLAPVNQYMGMRTYLRAVELWWDRPTSGPPKETQLWHRDYDDLRNVKVFVYFTDVVVDSGPFCFVPQTHSRGARRHVYLSGRITDEQMGAVFPESHWQICTASAGTVIFCDTSGYHKGLKPRRGERLMLTLQYTSAAAQGSRAFELVGTPAWALTGPQAWAAALRPGRAAVAGGVAA